MTISALIVAKNEELFIEGCIKRILPYVDEVIFVNNESTDRTRQIVEDFQNPKIKIFDYPETDNQGDLRQFSLDQATGDWIWQIDADEYYEPEACESIVAAVNNPGEAISFRVGYEQLSWRQGYRQANFEHYPDRLYRRDMVDRYDGLLPNDMTKVKREFYQYRPFLEYDNVQDKSFENPKQPILPVRYWHLARTRGYNFEYKKWFRYNNINHKPWSYQKIDELTRINQWVSGLYELEPVSVPFDIPRAKPKVSVIIPNFQYAPFVGQAIQSVLNQTYKAYEIIVIDDGSHDNSVEVIQEFISPETNVEIYVIPNGGVANARNVGANKATGDLLLFLDADDEIAPDYLEKTVVLMRGDTQVVYTDLQFIGDQQGVVSYPDYSLERMLEGQIIPSTCALIDRRLFEQVGGFDNGETFEDWGFWLRIAKKGFNFQHINEPLMRYRKHGVSRIDLLDSNMVNGYEQLRERYGITRKPNLKRQEEAKKIYENSICA